MLHRDDTDLVDRRANSTTLSVTTESHAQTKELHDALTASSEQRSKAAKHIQILMDVEETPESLTKTS
jgi:septum formation inhibitor MinC